MKRKLIRLSVLTFAYLAVLYPLWFRYKNISWSFDIDSILYNLFPGFGLAAFAILWLHAISGVFEPWLRKYFDFDKYVRTTSLIVFFCLILHPLLLLIILGFDFSELLAGGRYIMFGIVGWILLITYDVGKLLSRKYDFFVRNWHNILLISTIGFLLIFFHSINLGTDLQTGHLRNVWIFYGVTAFLATIHTYIIKKFRNR